MSAAPEIDARAAEWLMRREQPAWSTTDENELQAWLAQSMAHKAAFWRLEEGWTACDRLAAVGQDRREPRRFRQIWQAAIAASLVLVATWGASDQLIAHFRTQPRSVLVDAHTPVGGRKEINLADGSRITLNTASMVRTAISADHREVWLDRGEAYFDVAHDASRPFVIHVGSRLVTVLGTRFSLRLEEGNLLATVERGRVRIERPTPDGTDQGIVVTAGDFAIARDNALLVIKKSHQKVEDALSWRDGMLTFDRTTLAQAASEFNRYNIRQIRLVGPEVQNLQLGGTFKADHVDAFIRLLNQAFGLKVKEQADEIVISS